jgi:hypothetical protein
LADVESWLLGRSHADAHLNIDGYCLHMRKQVLNLPLALETAGSDIPVACNLVRELFVFAKGLTGPWPMAHFSRNFEEERAIIVATIEALM